jgi:hypothetical protein
MKICSSCVGCLALRVVEDDEKGHSDWRYNWAVGYKYGDLALQVGRVSNLRQ